MREIGALAVLCLICGCATDRPETGISLSTRLTGGEKEGDKVTVLSEEEWTVLDVCSRSGIGRAEISAADGKWPKRLMMRLHLRGLESLSVNNGKISVELSVISRPPYEQHCKISPVDRGRSGAVEETSLFWMPLRIVNRKEPDRRVIPLEDGYFEVMIPEALLEGNPRLLRVQWIDFFRG